MTSTHDVQFYIHIGLPKTATSTIQLFFTTHRNELLQQRVLYPRSIANSNGHLELHRVLSAAVELESVPWLANLRESLDIKNLIASLLEEIALTKANVVIFSAESLSFMRQPETLRRILAPYPVRILVYLRRQDSFLASFYNQLIKSRLYTATFEEFLRQNAANAVDLRDFRMSLVMCRYEQLLSFWANAFGRENIKVGIFEDFDLPLGILRDVAEKTGIEIAGLKPPATDTNPALQPSIVSLKRRVNGLLSTEAERIVAERLFSTCNYNGEEDCSGQRKASADVARRQSILASYQAGNALVAGEYFCGRSHLFNAPAEHDPPLPDSREEDWQGLHHGVAVGMIARLVADIATK